MIYHTIFIFLQALLFIMCVLVDYFPSHTDKDTEVGTVVYFSCVRVRVRVCYGRTYVYKRVRASVSKRPPGIRAPPAGAKERGPSGRQ